MISIAMDLKPCHPCNSWSVNRWAVVQNSDPTRQHGNTKPHIKTDDLELLSVCSSTSIPRMADGRFTNFHDLSIINIAMFRATQLDGIITCNTLKSSSHLQSKHLLTRHVQQASMWGPPLNHNRQDH